jgi:uncharacterized YigZ family protein
MDDHYETLAKPAEFRHKIERSEFLGIAFPVRSDDEFFEELTRIQKRYFDATHHCWAFRLFADERSRSSDAGEPSGTAGKPILSAIEGSGLTDIGVVVVRWYGGVKLGTGGLARAYRETSASVLGAAARVDVYLYEEVVVPASFDAMSQVYRLVDPPDIVLRREEFGETSEFVFDVRRSLVAQFEQRLREVRLTRK